ncbi:hypothetical protein RSAG8_11200, partial [Rhizoctonia solani AG-8 WAC10335]
MWSEAVQHADELSNHSLGVKMGANEGPNVGTQSGIPGKPEGRCATLATPGLTEHGPDESTKEEHTAPQGSEQTDTTSNIKQTQISKWPSPAVTNAANKIKDQTTSAKSALIWDRYMEVAEPQDKDTLDELEGYVTFYFVTQ